MPRAALVFGSCLASLLLAGCFDPSGGDGTDTASTGPTTASGGPASCVPGQLQPCVCPEGAGNQECNAEGTAYGPCQCVGGGSGETGPSGSTDPGDTTVNTSPPGSTGPSGGTDPGDTTDGTTTGPGATTGGEDSGTTMGLSATDPGSSGGFDPLDIGDPCASDVDCMTGVCWDFSDYDPLCFGTACSVNCVSDMECVAAMTAAGAPTPMASSCGFDGRCTTLGTGFGAYACAGPVP